MHTLSAYDPQYPLSICFSSVLRAMAGSFIPDFLVEATTNFRATQYTVATGCALWGYDILLILDQELKLLWSRRVNVLIKTIYILVNLVYNHSKGHPIVATERVSTHYRLWRNPFRLHSNTKLCTYCKSMCFVTAPNCRGLALS